jgi:hypothetical protein
MWDSKRYTLGAGGILLIFLQSACSDSTAPKVAPVAVGCTSASLTQLTPGAHLVIDPSTTGGCLRLPAAGASGAEHLVVALSATGQVTKNGLSAPYQLTTQGTGLTASAERATLETTQAFPPLSPAQRFHDQLRARGRALAEQGGGTQKAAGQRPSLAVVPPPLGSQRSFQVCGDKSCNGFVNVAASLKHIGPHGLLYLDNAAPANGYTSADLTRLGELFDGFMYPIDTTAFGRETDLDGNGAVIILLSPAVNKLSGNCNTTNSVILGFFFADDLVPGSPGSNGGEIFYGLVPDPTNSTCSIDRSFALRTIGPTFLHEFQHMISFGRHVVLAHGLAEDNWLDEGLSRLAEELGGREIPDSFCSLDTCASVYPFGDVQNAFDYLQKDTLERNPLIEPGNVDGTLPENGANWLFVRWLADHFASDTILGTSLSRALDGADAPAGTMLTGSTNVATTTSVEFPQLVGEWQAANFLTAVPGFSEPTGRLHYRSWDLASVFTGTFGRYPLLPDSVVNQDYSHTGALVPGSGRHVRVIQSPSAAEVDLLLSAPGGGAVDPTVVPRVAVVRVR